MFMFMFILMFIHMFILTALASSCSCWKIQKPTVHPDSEDLLSDSGSDSTTGIFGSHRCGLPFRQSKVRRLWCCLRVLNGGTEQIFPT